MFASTAGNNPGQSQSLLLHAGHPASPPGSLTLQSPLPPFVGVAGRLPGRLEPVRAHVRHDRHRDDDQRPEDGLRAGVEHRRAAADREEHGHRGALPRQPGQQRLAHLQPERSQHLRERVPRGVQERAAEPGDQRRQRPDRVRQQRPARPGARCRSSTRRSAPAARRRRSRPTRATPTAGSSRTCSRARPAGWPRRLAGNQNYLCRMVGSTFSPCVTRPQLHRAGPVPDELLPGESRTRSAAAQRRRRRLVDASTTRCSCSCAAATRTG